MGVQQVMISIDPQVADRARNASAHTGVPLSVIAEIGLAHELERMEAQHGKFPPRPNKRLPSGPGRGGRRGGLCRIAESVARNTDTR